VDEEAYRRARVAAAARDKSVSGLVREFLRTPADGEGDFDRLKRQEIELRSRIRGFRGGDRSPRDDVHKRHA
jgi:hypothetical protein